MSLVFEMISKSEILLHFYEGAGVQSGWFTGNTKTRTRLVIVIHGLDLSGLKLFLRWLNTERVVLLGLYFW